mmetsp:Transcript_43114/g.134062  ORF Transcript_43114/g.134062 Transcript_43114/m.134062 type:complete len:324 (-) Transcript_43114:34-1005(-)
MVSGYSVAFAVGCWYFHQSDPAAPEAPMVAGMKQALASPNGTGVCAQAASVMTVVDYMEKKVKGSTCPCLDPMWCLMSCVYTCFREMLEALCSFALVAVALDGGPLLETSRRAAATLGAERSAKFLVIDASLSWILQLQARALSTVVGLLAWVAIDDSQELGFFSFLARHTRDSTAEQGQWIVVLVVFVFYWLAGRPLCSASVVILIYIYLGDALISWPTTNCIMAALLVGSIASLVMHQFAETVSMALVSMLYCLSLEEATGGPNGGSQARCRRTVIALWEGSSALVTPGTPPASAPQEAGRPSATGQAREVQLAPTGGEAA